MIFLAVAVNAVYFYYFAAMCEVEDEFVEKLKKAPVLEWVVRVINSSMFLAIWFFMHTSVIIFFTYMAILYSTFITWDFMTASYLNPPGHEERKKNIRDTLINADAIGLILFVCLGVIIFWISKNEKELTIVTSFFLGFCVFGMLLNVVFAISRSMNVNAFNPFNPKYYKKHKVR